MNIEQLRDNVGDVLLEVLVEGGALRESAASLILSRSQILVENATTANTYIVNTSYMDGGNSVVVGIGRSEFLGVYNDLSNYPSSSSILKALGPLDGTKMVASKGERSKKFNSIVDWYNQNSTHTDAPLIHAQERQKLKGMGYRWYADAWEDGVIDDNGVVNAGSNQNRKSQTDAADDGKEDLGGILFGRQPPTKEDAFNIGRRNKPQNRRASSIVDKINDAELMAGDLYSDISRIPKPAVYSWLKLFKKETEGMGLSDENKQWKRSFILGYQVEPRVGHEIWYHSLDSTFGVYDYFGNIRGKRYHSMNEAVRGLINASLQFSKDDVEFFRNPANKVTVDSFFRPLTQTTDQFIKQMNNRENALYQKEKQEEIDRERAAERAEADKENAKFERERRAKAFRTTIKNSVGKGFNASIKPFKDVNDLNNAGKVERTPNEPVKSISGIVANRNVMMDDWSDDAMMIRSRILNPVNNRLLKNTVAMNTMISSAYRSGKINEDDVATLKGLVARISDIRFEASKHPRSRMAAMLRGRKELGLNAGGYFEDLELDNILTILFGAGKEKEPPHVKVKDGQYVASSYVDDAPVLNENMDFDLMMSDAEKMANIEADFISQVESPSYRAKVANDRGQFASTNTPSFKMIQKAIGDSVITYNDTKLRPQVISQIFSKSGKKNNVLGRGFWDRVKKFFMGVTERAEFIGGFSIHDKVHFEVWYLVVADIEKGEGVIASYFLFDVTSGNIKLIRGNMPYLRHAYQALLQKIGVIGH